LITDTVGFIQNLPHHLVAAFRATLEETVEADLLLHVVDITDPDYLDKIEIVEEVLDSLGADRSRLLTVFNKIDLAAELDREKGFMVSARTGEGLNNLLKTMGEILPK
jgi:GTP-binding protein HflX